MCVCVCLKCVFMSIVKVLGYGCKKSGIKFQVSIVGVFDFVFVFCVLSVFKAPFRF